MTHLIVGPCVTTAKELQFAKLSGLQFVGVDEHNAPQWMGEAWQFTQKEALQAADDRGDFNDNYPWRV